MGYFSNTTCIIIARGLEIFTISPEVRVLHEQRTGSVASKGALSRDRYPADYYGGNLVKLEIRPYF